MANQDAIRHDRDATISSFAIKPMFVLLHDIYGINQNGGSGGGPVTPTPPTITDFSPMTGSQILNTQPLYFKVTDDGALRRVILHAEFTNNLIQEVIHDGTSFGLKYQGATNVMNAIAGGYEYTILRDGGWPESPIISPFAIDVSGTENT